MLKGTQDSRSGDLGFYSKLHHSPLCMTMGSSSHFSDCHSSVHGRMVYSLLFHGCEKYTETIEGKKGFISSSSLSKYSPSWQLKYGQRWGVASQEVERDECCSAGFLFSPSYSVCNPRPHRMVLYTLRLGLLSSAKPGNTLTDMPRCVSPEWFKNPSKLAMKVNHHKRYEESKLMAWKSRL